MSSSNWPVSEGLLKETVALTVVLGTAVLLVVSHIYMTIPLTQDLADEYRVTIGAAAWVGSAFGFAFAVGNVLFPALSDYVDPRTVMAFGLGAVAVTGALAGAAPNLTVLIGVRAAQGFLAPALPPVALAYLPGVLADRHRATAMAVVASCFPLAGIVGQAWALAFQALLSWRFAFVGMAPPLIVLAVLVRRLPPVPRAGRRPPGVRGQPVVGAILRNPHILIAYTGSLTILIGFVGMYVALEAESGSLGASGPVGGLLLRLPGLPGIAVGWFAGVLLTRLGPLRTGAVAYLTSALGLGLAGVGGPVWVTLVATTVVVAGVAVAVPAAVTLVAESSGAARGVGMAGYGFLIATGASVAPLLVAALSRAGFAATCGVLAGIMLVPASAFAAGAHFQGKSASPV